MIPEAEYIEKTITVRDMRLPVEVTLTKKSLIRWLALALGLINPRESRRAVLDLIEVLMDGQLQTGKGMTVDEIMGRLDNKYSEKTVRYHLLRMERKGIVNRDKGVYSLRISDYDSRDITAIINEYDRSYQRAMAKIRDALQKLKGMY